MSKEAIELLEKAAKLLKTEAFMECCVAEACEGYVDQALAILKKQPVTARPEVGFTKRFRELIKLSEEHLSKNKIGRLQTYGKQAAQIIDRQGEEIKALNLSREGNKEGSRYER